jgi:ribonuclease P protein component
MGQQFTFTKQEKLTGETVVTALFQKGASYMAYPMRIVWTATKTENKPSLKVLMSVPKKKLKHAVDRNRVKRLLREAYRHHKQELTMQVIEQGLQVQMAFVWIPSEVLDYAKVEKKLKDALLKMQKLLFCESAEDAITINSLEND